MEDRINKKIGESLKNLRKNSLIKKKDITKILGVSSQQLTKYENGTNRISASKLILFLKEFGIDFNIFFNSNENSKYIMYYFNNIEDRNIKNNLIGLIKNISKIK